MRPATVVLASSPLVGQLTMRTLASALQAEGVDAVVPEAAADLDAWFDAVNTAAAGGARPLVLLGFSAAGPRMFAAAAGVQPNGLVFLDAGLPADGVAPDAGDPRYAEHLDRLTDPDGFLPPWPQWWPAQTLVELIPDDDQRARFVAECPRLPRTLFSTPLPAPPFAGPCAYVALGVAYQLSLEEARRRGWPARQLEGHHLSPLTDPDRVTAALLDVMAAW
jgi:hypothetical protein